MTLYTGKTVLVTGASRGIGLEVARQFGALGARVGLVASDPERLARAAGTLGGRSHAVAADLTERAECRRVVSEIEAALGPVEVLISSAGVLTRDFVEDVAEPDFERAWRLHVGAALWLSQAVLPAMRARRRGRIVFVGSELSIVGVPTYASYCASKSGLVGLAEVMRHELVGSGVRVSAVCPGDVRTDQLSGEQAWGPTGGASREDALSPEHVAAAVVRAAGGRRGLVVVDRPIMRLAFTLAAGFRRTRFWPVHAAFRRLLRERRPRAT